MSLWIKIKGTVETLFQIGASGPQVKNNSGVIEARNSTDTAFAVLRVADPVGANDALTLGSHDTLDTLAHNLSETCYTELTRDGSNRVTDVITWTTPAKTTKVREMNITRTSGRISQVVLKQYDGSGVLIQTLTRVIARSGGRISTITDTET